MKSFRHKLCLVICFLGTRHSCQTVQDKEELKAFCYLSNSNPLTLGKKNFVSEQRFFSVQKFFPNLLLLLWSKITAVLFTQIYIYCWASQVVLVVKNSPANAGDGGVVDLIPWRRAWQPTPVFLLEESHGQRSLAGYSLWGAAKSQTWLKRLSTHTHIYCCHTFYSNKLVHQSQKVQIWSKALYIPPNVPFVHQPQIKSCQNRILLGLSLLHLLLFIDSSLTHTIPGGSLPLKIQI